MASKLWETVKKVNAAIEGVVDAVVPGGGELGTAGKIYNEKSIQCQMPDKHGRKCTNNKPSLGHAHCKNKKCAQVYQNLLAHETGSQEVSSHHKHATVMRQQVWDEDKGKWVYPKPGKK